MPKYSPIVLRLFKEEAELEVWKQDTTGLFQILKIYPICRWSGDLGPKLQEGDRQAPEGFYTITPELMNPNSNFYLAINVGYPNSFDKANKRDGSLLMIHGDCSSSGCYAMTDEQISEIYSLARDSLLAATRSDLRRAQQFAATVANKAGWPSCGPGLTTRFLPTRQARSDGPSQKPGSNRRRRPGPAGMVGAGIRTANM